MSYYGGGKCLWLTGLSASGKTSLSMRLGEMYKSTGQLPIILDGDNLRSVFASKSFTKPDRINLSLTYSRLAAMLQSQGHIVIVAVIGMYSEVFTQNRKGIKNYFEIFLDVPISELEKRDPKGIYKRFRNGEAHNVSGLDLKVEVPKNPDFHYKWSEAHLSIDELAEQVWNLVEKN